MLRYMLAIMCSLVVAGCIGSKDRDPVNLLADDQMSPDDQTTRSVMDEIGSPSTTPEGVYAHMWGYWARDAHGETLFAAVVDGLAIHLQYEEREAACVEGSPYCLDNYINGTAVDGAYSGSNPVSGSAVWLGQARAIQGAMAYEGHSRLEADLLYATVDVDITGVGRDLSWRGLEMRMGRFAALSHAKYLSGRFFGQNHEGAAGRFWVGDDSYLVGVFGALRQ